MTPHRIEFPKTSIPNRPGTRAAAYLLVLSAVLCTPWASWAQSLQITGTVLDEGDRPIEGAEVTLYPSRSADDRAALLAAGDVYPEPEDRHVTGPDGRFRLAAPEMGFWTVVVWAKGRYPMEHHLEPVLGPTELEPVKLLPGVPVSILAVDNEGRPIPKAVIGAIGSSRGSAPSDWPGAWQLPHDRATATDEAGRAELMLLAGERVVLWGTAPGRSGRWDMGEPVTTTPKRPVEIILHDAILRRLQVLAPDGRPAIGAVVWAGPPIPAGVTDDEGLFAVPIGLEGPMKPVEVLVGLPGALTTTTEVRALQDAEKTGPPVRIRLTAAPVASGQVIEAGSGHGVPGALVWLDADPGAAVRTDPKGYYRIPLPLPFSLPGLTLQSVAPGFLTTVFPLEATERGSAVELNLVLDRATSLRGRVVSPDGEPVVEAKVLALPEEPRVDPRVGLRLGRFPGVVHGASDAEGVFRLDQVYADGSALLVSATGYAPLWRLGIVTEDAEGITDLGDLVLEPEAFLTGRVVDPDGNPVPGASILAGRPPGLSSTRLAVPLPTGAVETGPEGTFRVGGIAAGERAHLQVVKTGYAAAWVEGVRAPNDEPLTVVLRPEGAILGTVVDERGEPVADAMVRPPSNAVLLGGNPFRPTRTDDRGRFELAGLVPGKFSLEAEGSGYRVSAPRTVEIEPGERLQGVEIVLKRGVPVTGRDLDRGDPPAPEAQASPSRAARESTSPETAMLTGQLVGLGPGDLEGLVVRATRAGRLASGTRTGELRAEDGTYVIRDLPPGSWTVAAVSSKSGPQARGWIEIEPGQLEATLDLELSRGYTITGTVHADGQPVAGATVRGGGVDMGTSTSVMTDLDGRFRIEDVPAGHAPLLVRDPRSGALVFHRFEVDADLEVRIELELYRVRGLVLSADGSGPVSGASVRFELEPSEDPTTLAPSPRAETSDDGTFLLTGVLPGRGRLVVEKPGYHPHTSEIEVAGADMEVAPVYLGTTETGEDLP